jgi:hypothetical protein
MALGICFQWILVAAIRVIDTGIFTGTGERMVAYGTLLRLQ